MTIALGALLGVGLLLMVSPRLWPATGDDDSRRGGTAALVRDRLLQAGLPQVSALTFAVASVVLAAATGSLVFALVPVAALALAAALAGLVLPAVLVVARARARRRATLVVWPDVVDHLVSAVRSGIALPDSVVTLSRSGPPATRAAFVLFEADYRSTGNFGLCLDRLKARLADPVADRILETLRMSREVGGSELVRVLRNLSAYLRQEAAIRSEVEARQSWVMNAARLGVAAPWIVLLLLATRPEAALAYKTTAGGLLILGGFVVSVFAYRLMIAIGRLPEERRWFQ